jgi:putative choline sulfate-utilization transcription factor
MGASQLDLGWLQLFEAAARHENITRAAAELGMTQPALSYRLRRLEGMLGRSLFERRHRGLRLSQDGRVLYEAASQSLATLTGAVTAITRRSASPQVRLATDFAFASYWLMPRLPSFRRRHPDIDVHVVASQATHSVSSDGGDVAVVFGRATDVPPGARRFIGEEVVPVCSAGFRAVHGELDVADLARLPLLHLEGPPGRWFTWESYFGAAGIVWRPGQPDLSFNTYSLLVEAAAAGQGVGLGWRGLVDTLMATGLLVEACPVRLESERGYWLLPPRRPAAALLLADWLLAEAGNANPRPQGEGVAEGDG